MDLVPYQDGASNQPCAKPGQWAFGYNRLPLNSIFLHPDTSQTTKNH